MVNGLAGVASPLSYGGDVADLTRQELQELARIGAKSRLDELLREEAAIRRAFPDLFGGRRRRTSRRAAPAEPADPGAPAAGPVRRARRRSTMSAAARKAVSERMKKYWAARRKADAN